MAISENISLQMAIKTKKQLQSLFNFINFINNQLEKLEAAKAA